MEDFSDLFESGGIYDDAGNLIDRNLIPKPGLCIVCRLNYINDPEENLLCDMNRHDQLNDKEFKCGAFVPKESR